MALSSFQLIGQLIEGLMKPYIQFTYHLFKISLNHTIEKKDVLNKTFGQLLTELSNASKLYLIEPNNVPLNSWRNIAYHHNYSLEGSRIVCSYGTNSKVKTIVLNRRKLTEAAGLIYSFLKLIKINLDLFVMDNLYAIKKAFALAKPNKTIDLKEEVRLLDINYSISTQGFIIEDQICDASKTTFIIRDLTDEDPFKRGIHTSQFLYQLGLLATTKKVVVVYTKSDGTKYLVSSIQKKYVKLLSDEMIDFKEYKNHIKLDFVGDSKINSDANTTSVKNKEKDPFLKHLITAVPSEQTFYSQKGQKLPVKEFIKDFTLGIFNNYLLLREQGVKQDAIQINVGKDGSLVRTNEKGGIILQLPAIIREKFVQQIILLCLNDVISYYENGQLASDLIEQSKKQHDFLLKTELVNKQLNQFHCLPA